MGKTILLEGRYDSITGKVVRDIFWAIEQSKDYPVDEMANLQLPYSKDGTDFYETEKSKLFFDAEINIMRTTDIGLYKVESFLSDDGDTLMFNMLLNPDNEPSFYQDLYYKLQEDVRHELEHVLQDMGRGDRPELPDDDGDVNDTNEYHRQPHEVPALVQGFYRRAKLERKPIDEVMSDDLDDEIEKGNLTKEQAEEILRIWVLYSKRRHPKAIYSKH